MRDSDVGPLAAVLDELRAIRQTQAEILGLLRSRQSSRSGVEESTGRRLEAVGRPLGSVPAAPTHDPWPRPNCTAEGRMDRLILSLQERSRGPQ